MNSGDKRNAKNAKSQINMCLIDVEDKQTKVLKYVCFPEFHVFQGNIC